VSIFTLVERLEHHVLPRLSTRTGTVARPAREILRAEVTILATMLFCAVGLPLALRCWLLGAPGVAAAVATLMSLGIVNVLALRRARQVRIFAHAAVSLLVSLLVVAGLYSGGFYDPAFSWLFVAPLLAFLLTDLHGGWAWTALVSGITVGFWACDAVGISLGSLTPPSQRAMQGLADRLSNLTGLAAVATAFLFSRKRAEQELVAANERLTAELTERRRAEEEALAAAIAKTSFLAHMSHEIRTPMVGILGAADLLLQTQLTARQHGLATTVEASTRALLGILNNVLDLSRMDAGRLTVSVEPVDARLVCEDVAELLAAPAASRGIDLVVAWGAEIPRTAVADPLRLRQVLVNLVGNAVKFTEHGHVAVRAALAPDGPDGERRLRIAVEDTGIGVADAKLATLFEPFVQADLETTRRYGGSGLGLAITKQLVEAMGGAIGAHSTPGEGSAFWFTLPLASTPRDLITPPALIGRRVLAVSNRPQTLAVLTAVLSDWQVAIRTTDSVADACTTDATAFAADMLLVDVRVDDAAALWVDGTLRPELPRRTILLVAPQAAALRLCGDVHATIALPLRERHLLDALVTHGAALPRPAPPPRLQARVLVADDVEINREVVRELLQQIGCTVDVAASGLDAVEQCRTHPYDLVFMDCHMPQLDGFQATQMIRAEPGPNRTTPIIALTASAFSDERVRCAAIGMSDYLTKPIGRSELAACLERHVPRPAALAGTNPLAVLDVDATLDRIGGNTQLFTRLITIFRRQTPLVLAELRDALAAGDATGVRNAAHKLNGSLRSVGGRAAQGVAELLERRAREDALADAAGLYASLEVELARLDDMIGGHLASS
jgi:hypothetical protein